MDARQLLVVAPTFVRVGLGESRKLGRSLGVRALEDSVATKSLTGIDGLLESSLKG